MKWLELLGQASLSAAVMILAAVILRVRFRNQTPQRVYCLLWDIVLLRLLVPVSIRSPFSIRGLRLPHTAQALSTAGISGLHTAQAVIVEDTAVQGTWAAVQPAPVHTLNLLPLLWCAGTALCAAWLFWGHLQSRSLYAMSLPVEDGFIRSWQDRHPLRRFVQVRRSDRISAPLTYGVLQPVVLLPSGMDLTDRENLIYVLEHEYTHIRRFDTLRKCLLAAGLCLHWFNPLVWLMYVLANRDIELACDEAVVRSGADRRGYALALLRLEEERSSRILSGSHFSGRELEERIEAIMKHKKVSLAALLAVLVIMSVTTTVFATSAPEDKNNSPLGLVTGREVSVITQDVLTISRGPDGERYFSVDGGEEWMPEERYQAQYGSWGGDWDVEWWTYDEYKAWLENEKKELADIIGARGYTSDKGWFVWDQAMVDEIIAMYEETLEHIKNGGLYSKNITDSNGAVVEEAVLSSGTIGMEETTAFTAEDWSTVSNYSQDIRRQAEETAALLQSLQAFGVTGSESEGLYYNGQPIRCLADGYSMDNGAAIGYVYHNDMGTVDVHTLRETVPLSGGGVDPNGPLTGVVQRGEKGFDAHLIECAMPSNTPQQTAAVSTGLGGSSDRGRTFEEIFAAYEKYGLSYDAGAKNEGLLTYNGQPVRGFADLRPDGGAFSYENPFTDAGLRVYTQYDANGQLTALTAE